MSQYLYLNCRAYRNFIYILRFLDNYASIIMMYRKAMDEKFSALNFNTKGSLFRFNFEEYNLREQNIETSI